MRTWAEIKAQAQREEFRATKTPITFERPGPRQRAFWDRVIASRNDARGFYGPGGEDE